MSMSDAEFTELMKKLEDAKRQRAELAAAAAAKPVDAVPPVPEVACNAVDEEEPKPQVNGVATNKTTESNTTDNDEFEFSFAPPKKSTATASLPVVVAAAVAVQTVEPIASVAVPQERQFTTPWDAPVIPQNKPHSNPFARNVQSVEKVAVQPTTPSPAPAKAAPSPVKAKFPPPPPVAAVANGDKSGPDDKNKFFQPNSHFENLLGGRCIHCHQFSSMTCSSCGRFYCSRKCQTDDWPTHSTICRPIPDLTSVGDYLSKSLGFAAIGNALREPQQNPQPTKAASVSGGFPKKKWNQKKTNFSQNESDQSTTALPMNRDEIKDWAADVEQHETRNNKQNGPRSANGNKPAYHSNNRRGYQRQQQSNRSPHQLPVSSQSKPLMQSYPTIPAHISVETIYTPMINAPVKVTFGPKPATKSIVFITSVLDGGHCFIRTAESDAEYKSNMKEIEQYGQMAKQLRKLPVKGQLIMAIRKGTSATDGPGRFARALVCQEPLNEQFAAAFLDFGDLVPDVKYTDCYELAGNLQTLTAFTHKCNLLYSVVYSTKETAIAMLKSLQGQPLAIEYEDQVFSNDTEIDLRLSDGRSVVRMLMSLKDASAQ